MNTYKLIFKSKFLEIPSNFPSIVDVHPNIYQKLIEYKQYEVQSDVNEKIFDSFLKQWINNKMPFIQQCDVSQYEKLSLEFDRMKDIIQLYKKNYLCNKNQALNKNTDLYIKRKALKSQLTSKKENYQKIIKIIKCNDVLSRESNEKEKILKECLNENVNLVHFLSFKKVEKNGILYLLEGEQKMAFVYQNLTFISSIFIPNSIDHESETYIVTMIFNNAFKNSKTIKTIQFEDDSKLRVIGDSSFQNSSIEKISIPSTLKKICENAFADCNQLKDIEFNDPCELQFIGKFAFSNCSIHKVSIPHLIEKIDRFTFANCSKL